QSPIPNPQSPIPNPHLYLRKYLELNLIKKDNFDLTYSIKSMLGRPATILNSSKHTNFIYEVKNSDIKKMKAVNSINTRTKLLDRINKIKELKGDIVFCRTASDTLDYNLKLIDTKMPFYIANTLVYSYEFNNKNLKDIFRLANKFEDKKFADKKLRDFIAGAMFGFFPSIKGDGDYSVDGGILIVLDNGQVVTIDMVYYLKEVRKFLIENAKLDSPSSSRYHMLEIIKKGQKYYFSLNLQVRFKR
ncbi:MAG: HpaII family restriction endonuclease, partial [Coriobacteriales bacterium]|nr:HpaII family restriction endonuclease [Coriobacteriales bacterium]